MYGNLKTIDPESRSNEDYKIILLKNYDLFKH